MYKKKQIAIIIKYKNNFSSFLNRKSTKAKMTTTEIIKYILFDVILEMKSDIIIIFIF